MPLLFLKTGWMARYNGLKGDPIFSTMRHVQKYGSGHERNNFKTLHGKCFGYAPVSGVNIQERFGADRDATYIDDIDVIWAANRPKPLAGLVIVGWYRNARVYRHQRPEPSLIIAEAKAKDCVLLPIEERLYNLPLNGPGAFRTARVWYGEAFPAVLHDVQNMLSGNYKVPRGRISIARSQDPDLTRKSDIEKAAIDHVTKHYIELGFHVESVEDQNLGWDLEVKGHRMTMLIEVKGTSHSQIMPLLTPNEYKAALTKKVCYHLCIVTDALTQAPSFTDLRYATDVDGWIANDAEIWDIVAVTSGQARPRK